VLRAPSASTQVAGVIGEPIHHSLSPVLHNAAFAAAGLDWVYVAFPVRAGHGAAAVDAMRTLGLAGLSVTMPHKASVAGAVDRLSPVARRLGAVNTVRHEDGALVGDSTDGPGLVDALRGDQGWHPSGRRCIVLGTGGAARAVTLALAEAGAASVRVVGRRAEAATSCAALAGSAGATAGIEEIAGADLVVDATPVGMGPDGDGLAFGLDPARLGSGQLVVDLVYTPAVTPLLAAAAARGATVANGLGMLVHQAARQFAAWTGEPAPIGAMREAATVAVAARPG
jgi:shikimate dehydrogenase